MKLSKTKISVLDAFETRTDAWTYVDFERALKAAMGSHYKNYQTAKLTIVDADKEGHWPETVKKYVLSNLGIMGNSPVELVPIANRLIPNLTPREITSFNLQRVL